MTMQYPTNHPTPTDPAHSPTRSILVSRGSPVPRVHAPPPVPASNEANDGYYGMPRPSTPPRRRAPSAPSPLGPAAYPAFPRSPTQSPPRSPGQSPPRSIRFAPLPAGRREERARATSDDGFPTMRAHPAPAPVSQQAHQYPPQPQYQYRRPAPVPLQPQHQVPGPRRTAAYQSLRSLYVADLHREKMVAEQDVPGEEQDITELIASQRGW